ncbi:MAG: carboxylating nicotinate-nucleotide diphosphorylase [Bacteroidales bacterium]|nr:carboxylating nicotinate-nucleotide diphosphorylase [Bacteroidales bacterium]
MTIDEIIEKALEEDIGEGDHTSLAVIPKNAASRAKLIARENGILAGVEIARKVFNKVDSHSKFDIFVDDGDKIKPGDIIFRVKGKPISILSAERIALNFLQRLSGIATHTRKLVSQLEGLNTKLLDTRKTTPLLRELEKYAVRMGGGENHRMGLYDMVMIKDNHIDFAGGIKEAIEATTQYLRLNNKDLKVEIEVRNFTELDEVLKTGGIHRIMLDNFTPENLKKAINKINGRFETEASGGITLKNIREYALSGVDYISSGAITHQINSLDMSLVAD